MKYNEKYKRWFTKGGLVYRYSKSQDKLVLCKQGTTNEGYKIFSNANGRMFSVHRAVYETFVGEIPAGYQIDHINAEKDDNRLENLRAVTPKENMNNPLTKKLMSECQKNRIQHNSGFSNKYFKHFGYGQKENPTQYKREYLWFKRYGKCRWE